MFSHFCLRNSRQIASIAISILVACLAVGSVFSADAHSQQISKLIQKLGSDDFSERDNAAKDLVDLGAPAIEPLRNALKSRDPEVVSRAKRCIEDIERAQTIASLIKDVKNPDPKARARAANGLMQYGPLANAAVPALIEAIDDPDDHVRHRVIVAFGLIGKDSAPAVSKLINVIKDKKANHDLRWSAAIALEEIGEPAREAIPALLKMLDDPEGRMRQAAATALGGVAKNDRGAVAALIRSLNDPYLRLQHNAATSLGRIGQNDPSTLPALIEQLRKHKGFKGVDDPRVGALAALERFGPRARASIPALVDILEHETDKSHLAHCAIDVLNEIGPLPREAVAILQKVKRETFPNDMNLSHMAARVLARLEGKNPPDLREYIEMEIRKAR